MRKSKTQPCQTEDKVVDNVDHFGLGLNTIQTQTQTQFKWDETTKQLQVPLKDLKELVPCIVNQIEKVPGMTPTHLAPICVEVLEFVLSLGNKEANKICSNWLAGKPPLDKVWVSHFEIEDLKDKVLPFDKIIRTLMLAKPPNPQSVHPMLPSDRPVLLSLHKKLPVLASELVHLSLIHI